MSSTSATRPQVVVRVLLRGFAAQVGEVGVAGQVVAIVGPADAKKWPHSSVEPDDREGVTWCAPTEASDVDRTLRGVPSVIDVSIEVAE